MIWSPATIQRFVEDGETEISSTVKCILNRTALTISAGTPLYSLPNDLLDISRVTWLAKKIDPCPARNYHEIDTITQTNEPLWYVFNQQGRNTIRFHPIPSINVTKDDLTDDLWGANIGDRVIVEYYQLTDSDTVKIPDYIRRRLIKYFVLMHCFQIEGVGQNLKVSAKMKERYDFYINIFGQEYMDTFTSKLSALESGSYRLDPLAPPRLSDKFGEEGEF